mmetsp:Transcript_31669/g.75530  ORF Transcript_31669/g.75530 Transcript_31669/m.75530 type:complete len:299 (-) Transcript_31669:515-1411(-)
MSQHADAGHVNAIVREVDAFRLVANHHQGNDQLLGEVVQLGQKTVILTEFRRLRAAPNVREVQGRGIPRGLQEAPLLDPSPHFAWVEVDARDGDQLYAVAFNHCHHELGQVCILHRRLVAPVIIFLIHDELLERQGVLQHPHHFLHLGHAEVPEAQVPNTPLLTPAVQGVHRLCEEALGEMLGLGAYRDELAAQVVVVFPEDLSELDALIHQLLGVHPAAQLHVEQRRVVASQRQVVGLHHLRELHSREDVVHHCQRLQAPPQALLIVVDVSQNSGEVQQSQRNKQRVLLGAVVPRQT